jgi:tetratricopeptide (TPR) repeat protein
MKASEKRHELQKNDLADWVGHQIEDVKPHFVPILVVSLTVVAVIVGVFLYFGSQSSVSASAWNAYFSAFSEREAEAAFSKVIKDQQGNDAALWARQSLADVKLAEGDAQLFRDRKQAEESLSEAERLYKEIVDAAPGPMLLARARYGLARVYESQCKPEEARKYYDLVVKSPSDSGLEETAARSYQRLGDKRNVELLAWFAKQTPKPPPAMGSPFDNPAGPGASLPARPDISIPEGFGVGEPAIGNTPGAPAIGGKPLIEQKPEDRQPAEPKADAKPAEPKADAKPAEPKADVKPAEQPKADAKPAEQPKADAKPAEPKADAKPAEPKADAKPAEGDK